VKLILISRPKFWIYLIGPYLIGSLFGSKDLYFLSDINHLLMAFYFLIPANIFLYGVNDLYDHDTDIKNERKGKDENLLSSSDNQLLKKAIILFFILSCIIFLFLGNLLFKLSLIVFIVLSYFYSAPPFRFKAIPILDFLSNSLYFLPGFAGYFLSSTTVFNFFLLIPFIVWTSAMHLFSAIPDILPDKKSKIMTSAVFFGRKKSLALCLFFWMVFFIYFVSVSPLFYFFVIFFLFSFGSIIYSCIMIKQHHYIFFNNNIYKKINILY
jgi:4-hydroxybenzoate polyprenyltransferase